MIIKIKNSIFIWWLFLTLPITSADGDKTCPSLSKHPTVVTRYLLYTVNYGEGFNLRRDVYVRLANLVHKLNKKDSNVKWVLVLPPWHRVYHWFNSRSSHPQPWGQFFDLATMNKYIPVMELDDYIAEVGRAVSRVFILQHYAEGWGSAWEEKYEERPCIEEHDLQDRGGVWEGPVSGRLLHTPHLSCLSVQGTASVLLPLITSTVGNSVLVSRGETVLHDHFAGPAYWAARRSMAFAAPLVATAARYREEALLSTDRGDGVAPGSAPPAGGPYLAVHLRRRDFVQTKRDQVPSLQLAAEQVLQLLRTLGLQRVFLATDAPQQEVSELTALLQPYTLLQYTGDGSLSDGQLAVVDQIIASHARHFIGSHESTFSYRIQEEREILGFPANSTFNRLCGASSDCEQPPRWPIVY